MRRDGIVCAAAPARLANCERPAGVYSEVRASHQSGADPCAQSVPMCPAPRVYSAPALCTAATALRACPCIATL